MYRMDQKSIDNMVKSIVRNHHWAPESMGALYFDSLDMHGLVFWYADVIQADKQMKEELKKNNPKK